MSTIATVPQSTEGVGPNLRLPAPAAKPAAVKTSKPVAAPRADQVSLKNPVNPYQGFADQSERVNVDRWKKGPNDSIEHILRNQGYSSNDIYRRDAKGHTLIQRVAEANGLKDPNLIRPGHKGLLVPVKGKKEAVAVEVEQAKPTPVQAPKEETKPAPVEIQPQPVETPKAEIQPQPVETPKVEVKPEPVETPKVEAEKPAEKPHRGFFSRLFGRHQDETPEPVKTQEPVQPTPEPVKTTPESVPAQPQAQPVSNEELQQKESAEVGLLLQGVKDQKFTRSEFQALNSTANQYTELRAQYAKDGFQPEQVRELSQVQQQYGQMYARFLADDKAKVSFAGGDAATPAARFRAQQNEEGGQYYDQFVGQQIDEATIKARLLDQRQASSRGVQPQ